MLLCVTYKYASDVSNMRRAPAERLIHEKDYGYTVSQGGVVDQEDQSQQDKVFPLVQRIRGPIEVKAKYVFDAYQKSKYVYACNKGGFKEDVLYFFSCSFYYDYYYCCC